MQRRGRGVAEDAVFVDVGEVDLDGVVAGREVDWGERRAVAVVDDVVLVVVDCPIDVAQDVGEIIHKVGKTVRCRPFLAHVRVHDVDLASVRERGVCASEPERVVEV